MNVRNLREPEEHCVDGSVEMYERALKVIPGGAGTFSKSATQLALGYSPMMLERAKGSRVWDVDGNEYVDYMMGLGPIILGHCYGPVVEAQKKQLDKGQAFSLTCPVEIEVAELLCEVIPSAEMVRFAKNGSDVTSAAIKLARFVTGREHIAAGGYHGFQDWYIGLTDRSGGVPEGVKQLSHRFNQKSSEDLERVFSEYPEKIAAVIIEPAMHSSEPDRNLLTKIVEIAHANGALVIFDEIITGFRFDVGGVQRLTGVTPDLSTFGKAMANGAPVSAVVGKKEFMKYFGNEVFFSFTFAGEAVSLVAAKTTIEILRDEDVTSHIGCLGKKLRDGTNELAKKHGIEDIIRCIGPDVCNVISFSNHSLANAEQIKTCFIKEANIRGILSLGYHNISYSHTEEDVALTLCVYDKVFEILSERLQTGDLLHRLGCPAVAPVFRPR